MDVPTTLTNPGLLALLTSLAEIKEAASRVNKGIYRIVNAITLIMDTGILIAFNALINPVHTIRLKDNVDDADAAVARRTSMMASPVSPVTPRLFRLNPMTSDKRMGDTTTSAIINANKTTLSQEKNPSALKIMCNTALPSIRDSTMILESVNEAIIVKIVKGITINTASSPESCPPLSNISISSVIVSMNL